MPGEQADRLGDEYLDYDPWTGQFTLTNPDDEDEDLEVQASAIGKQDSSTPTVDSTKTFKSYQEKEDYYRSFFDAAEENPAETTTTSSGGSSGGSSGSSAPTAPEAPSLTTPRVGEGGRELYSGSTSSWINSFLASMDEYADLIGDLSSESVAEIESAAAEEAEEEIDDMFGREDTILTGGQGLLGEDADILKTTLLGGS